MTEIAPNPVGQSVPRSALPRLIAGRGRFVDDIVLPGMLHAAAVRSPIPHGEVSRFDDAQALQLSGVVDVVTPTAAREQLAPVEVLWQFPGMRGTSLKIGDQRLRFTGQPFALVVAKSRAIAEDGIDCLDIEYRQFPAVLQGDDALDPQAPRLYPDWDSNLAGLISTGDDIAACEAVFSEAAHVIEHRSELAPISPHPMETRGIVADWDAAAERLAVWISTQAPHDARDQIAAVLGLRTHQVDVIAPDVGGAFGSKVHVYADELLVCLASMRLGRPVKWIEDRSEHIAGTDHGRNTVHRSRLAFTESGRFLALHTEVRGSLGAYPSSSGIGPFFVSIGMLQGPYRFERAGGTVEAVVTNTTPTGSYRGFGNTEATFVRERLVDEAARQLGMDPVELRLMNMISSVEMPYQTRSHAKYDSGDYRLALETTRTRVDGWTGARADGRRRGIGFGFGVEYTGLGPAQDLRWIGFNVTGHETVRVQMHADASVTVSSALIDMGQGLETTLAQLAAGALGVPIDDVKVVLGDTRSTPYSSAGSMTSRSIVVGGPAVQAAADELRGKLVAIAAHQMEVDPADLTVSDGSVRVSGRPGEQRSLKELAESAWLGWNLPDGMALGLDETQTYSPTGIPFSYAAHAAAVAIDPATGEVEVEAYWVTHDCGVVVNPAIVDAQIHGAVAQGIGNALFEEVQYDEGGLIDTTFGNHRLPRASDIPDLVIEHLCSPSPVTPGGMKGMGEGGTIVSVATVANAVAAALPEISGSITFAPLTASRIWNLLDRDQAQDPRRD